MAPDSKELGAFFYLTGRLRSEVAASGLDGSKKLRGDRTDVLMSASVKRSSALRKSANAFCMTRANAQRGAKQQSPA